MQASIVDLRYKSKEIVSALDRGESVQILYRGKPKGVISPQQSGVFKKSIKDHPFFGMSQKYSHDEQDVVDIINTLRSGRFDTI